jgi:hypothetical protein
MFCWALTHENVCNACLYVMKLPGFKIGKVKENFQKSWGKIIAPDICRGLETA